MSKDLRQDAREYVKSARKSKEYITHSSDFGQFAFNDGAKVVQIKIVCIVLEWVLDFTLSRIVSPSQERNMTTDSDFKKAKIQESSKSCSGNSHIAERWHNLEL